MLNFWFISIFSVILFIQPSVQQLRKFYMEDDCGGGNAIYMQPGGIFAGRLRPSRWSRYRANMRCTVTIIAPADHRLLIVFRKLDIEFEPSCDDDYLKLFDGNSTSAYPLSGLPRRVCGSRRPAGSFATSGHALTVHFKSDSWSNEDGFDIVFTSFHNAPCREGEIRCASGKCIDASLKCDGIDNCGDNSDECSLSTEAIIGISFGITIVTCIAIAIVTYIKRKKKSSQHSLKIKQQIFDVHHQIRILSEKPSSSSESQDFMNTGSYNKTLDLDERLP